MSGSFAFHAWSSALPFRFDQRCTLCITTLKRSRCQPRTYRPTYLSLQDGECERCVPPNVVLPGLPRGWQLALARSLGLSPVALSPSLVLHPLQYGQARGPDLGLVNAICGLAKVKSSNPHVRRRSDMPNRLVSDLPIPAGGYYVVPVTHPRPSSRNLISLHPPKAKVVHVTSNRGEDTSVDTVTVWNRSSSF